MSNINFSSEHCGCAGLYSTWQENLHTNTIEIQTNDQYFKDELIQVIERFDIGTQTTKSNNEIMTKQMNDMKNDEENMNKEGDEDDNTNIKFYNFIDINDKMNDNIIDFLNDIIPIMENELNENINSNAFNEIEFSMEHGIGDSTNNEESILYKYTLSFDDQTLLNQFHNIYNNDNDEIKINNNNNNNNINHLQCTGLSWSATGSMIFGSFGRYDISGWCDIPGTICGWNLFSRDFNHDKPNIILDHSSCIMCVAAHPTKPSWIAGGSFNGEVLVWDISKDLNQDDIDDENQQGTLIGSSSINDLFHREPITKLQWIFDPIEDDYRLVSIAGDGKILCWSIKNKLSAPSFGFRLQSKKNIDNRRNLSYIGGTSLTFSIGNINAPSFICGSEGGSMFRGFFLSSNFRKTNANTIGKDLRWTQDAGESLLHVPSRKLYELTNLIEIKVKEKNHKTVHLNDIYMAKPKSKEIYPEANSFKYHSHSGPILSLNSSPFHRNLFLSSSADGSVRLYNTLQNQEILSFYPTLQTSSAYIYDVEWSPKRPLLFGVVTGDGKLILYDLLNDHSIPFIEAETPNNIKQKIEGDKKRFDKKKNPMLSISFNPKQRDFIATADSNGYIHIWRMNWYLSNIQPNELESLNELYDESLSVES